MKPMKPLILIAALAASLFGQQPIRWSATTGDVSLSGAATAATIQQPATNPSQAAIDQVVVYCSVACIVTTTVNGVAATTTAGSFKALLPTQIGTPIPLNFFTASNTSGGTTQGGVIHIPAGGTVTLCFSPSCGNPQQYMMSTGDGTADNFTISVGSITGTANFTFYGRSF